MGSIVECYLMNESNTFCSRYICAIKTRFTRDYQNDDSISEDEVIVEFEVFIHKVLQLTVSCFSSISQEEQRLFHWSTMLMK